MPWKRTPTGGWEPVYGPDRRPEALWPVVDLFPSDLERKIADMLAPRPRLPTPKSSLQLMRHPIYRPGHGNQFLDAVRRFIDSYLDEVDGTYWNPHRDVVFVDWDAQGRATFDLSRVPDSDDDSDDSDADDADTDDELADALVEAQIVIDEISAEAQQVNL